MTLRLLIFAAAMFACAAARAEAPYRVLILPFENTTPSPAFDELSEGAADLLVACLSRYASLIEVVDRAALGAIVHEQGLQWQGLLEDDRLRTSLAVSGAQYLLRGTLAQAPEGLLVSGTLYDVHTTRLLHTADATGPVSKISALICDEIAVEVTKHIGGDTGDRPELRMDPAPKQTQLLIVGMGYYYNRHYAKAFPAFMKLLREDPGNAKAQFWLAQSFHKANLNKFAKQEIKKFLKDFPNNKKSGRARSLLRRLEEIVQK